MSSTELNDTHSTEKQGQFALLAQQRFGPFFGTQFFGAMNDNVFKFAFTLLVTYQGAKFSTLDPKLVTNLIAGVFILPFVLFSATSGQLADKFDKATLMRFVKWLELGIMVAASAGFYFHSLPILLSCTFAMGVHSTLFGPAKYAYLPQHLKAHEVVGGNGLVEMGTFVAILLGTMAGGALVDSGDNSAVYSALTCIAVAVIGLLFALRIPSTPSSQPDLKIDWNPFTVTWDNLMIAKRERAVFLSLLGISWLWFFGATFLTQFASFAKDVLGGKPAVVTLLLAVFSLGIGIGSLLCEKLSGHKVEIGLVPFGSIGMTVFGIDLYFASRGLAPVASGPMGVGEFLSHPEYWRVMADLFLLSMFSGFYSVPLYALIQTRCEATHRARIIAANNILNALFMVASAAMAIVLLSVFKFSIPQLFLVIALLNAVVAIYIYSLVPEFLMRFLSWLLVCVLYRLKKQGTENIPDTGAALLVCNHVSFVDALVLMASSPRPIRFVMDHNIFKVPVLSWIFRTVRAIPIAPAKEDPQAKERAFAHVSGALRDGDLVCIFPEGRITDTGQIYPFKPGAQTILERDPVPVIPMALQGLWGSYFSRKDGPAMSKPLRRGAFSRIGLNVGAPITPAQATPEHLQAVVTELRGDWV